VTLDRLLDRAPCGFVSFADDGTMREVNLTLAELLGYARAELEGWHLQKVLPPGARVFYHTHVFPLLKLHGHADELYVALRTKDGRDIPMLMNGIRRPRDGDFANDCIFVPMQQRNKFEDELLAARRVAEQANAAKAKFLSMMSHDLRTPLTTITGHAKLLLGGVHGPLADEQQDGLARIRDAGELLMRMINDILSFSRLDSGHVEVIPVAVPVAEVVARAEALIRLRMDESGLAFETSAIDGVSVLADPDRLQQILLNLLTNAMKFTASGGRISVTAERAAARVLVRVADTGSGIAPEQLERVFEPFVQLRPARQLEPAHRGVGLGLAISRDLARAMDGDLTATSVVGEGSVFTISLPGAP
jgi:PAS domain S-box-containing protein